MWNINNREQFNKIVEDILNDPDVQALSELTQHHSISRLDHSVYVAYLSFLWCRRMGYDHVAAARAGLLHDFHFGKDEEGIKRLWRHPHKALQNANDKYELSEVEQDIIVKHMWPLSRKMPSHKETYVVSMTDKICAVMEFLRLYKLFKVKNYLSAAPSVA